MKNNSLPILIVGATGKTGARVNQQLQDMGIETRPVSRSSTPAFDWEKPETWAAAVEGTRAAYVTYQPDLTVPGATDAIAGFASLAKDYGLEQIVLLSGRGEDGAEAAEAALQNSGIPWTLVRASWFFQNFSESFMLDGILSGELTRPATDIPEPFIDADDIAEVAVAALSQPGHLNRLYEVTGPRSFTFAQAMQEISSALGRTVKFTHVPVDQYIQILNDEGIPEEMQWLLRELFTTVLDGRNSQVMPGVHQALGRDPRDFQRYIQKTTASGVWAKEGK